MMNKRRFTVFGCATLNAGIVNISSLTKLFFIWTRKMPMLERAASKHRTTLNCVLLLLMFAPDHGATSEQSTWLRPCEFFQPSTTKAVYDDLKRRADSGDIDAAYEWTRIARLDDLAQYTDRKARDAMLDKLAAQGHKGAIAKTLNRNITSSELGRSEKKSGEDADDRYVRALIAAAEALDADAATELMRIARGEKVYRPLRGNLVKQRDTRKWAELAGQLGSPLAQEHMCGRLAVTGRVPEEGFDSIDPISTLAWCARATKNACDYGAPNQVAKLYERGDIKTIDPGSAARFRELASERFQVFMNPRGIIRPTQEGEKK